MRLAWLVVTSGCAFRSPTAGGHDAATSDTPADVSADAEPDAVLAVPCPAADPDLIACYHFDGTLADGSSYGNHATGTTYSFVTGRAGMALATSGASDVFVADSTSLDGVTTGVTSEAWVRPSSLPQTARTGILDNAGQFAIFLYPGETRCSIGANGQVIWLIATTTLPVATWTHVACVYDGTTFAQYHDGAMAASMPVTGTMQTSGGGMGIGMNSPSGEQFDGVIDDLRIWRRALAPSELGR